MTMYIILNVEKLPQGSRLTLQLASPVASDRFYSLAKTNFSLARSIMTLKSIIIKPA